MNIDISTATSIASLVVGILALFPRNPRNHSEEQREALAAVSDAYHTTRKYLEHREHHQKDREREIDIAQKWDHAAMLLQPFDPKGEIHHRLNFKGRIWREGADWEEPGVKAANIGLSTVWRDVQMHLKELKAN